MITVRKGGREDQDVVNPPDIGTTEILGYLEERLSLGEIQGSLLYELLLSPDGRPGTDLTRLERPDSQGQEVGGDGNTLDKPGDFPVATQLVLPLPHGGHQDGQVGRGPDGGRVGSLH